MIYLVTFILILSEIVAYEGLGDLAFLGTIIMGVAHGLKLLAVQPAFSNNLISSSTNFLINRIRYGLHATGGPAVGISIWKRLILPTSVGDLEMMLLYSSSSKEDSPSLASCST